MKDIVYKKQAQKALRKMPKNSAKTIVSKIISYAKDPASQSNNITNRQGRDGIRLRVGNWRVIMKDGIVLDILDIGSRGSIY